MALMSGVSPETRAAFGSAFASSSNLIMAVLPFPLAVERAVAPYSLFALTFAPARISNSTSCKSLRSAAQISAVEPSGRVALTSAWFCKSCRTAFWSPFRTASINRRSALPPASPMTGKRSDRRKVSLSREFISHIEFSCAVPKRVKLDYEFVQQGLIQVRHWRVLWVSDVTTPLDASSSACDEQSGQVFIQMQIAVAECAAVNDQCMIQQRSVAVGNRPH